MSANGFIIQKLTYTNIYGWAYIDHINKGENGKININDIQN